MPTRTVVVPCLPVSRNEIAEARRALTGQGRKDLHDNGIVRALWLARALPAVLDVLSDTSLLDVTLDDDVFIEATAVGDYTPLTLIAWRRDDELLVEAIVIDDHDVSARAFDNSHARLLFSLSRRPLASPPPTDPDISDDITAEEKPLIRKGEADSPQAAVRLQRFSFGKGLA